MLPVPGSRENFAIAVGETRISPFPWARLSSFAKFGIVVLFSSNLDFKLILRILEGKKGDTRDAAWSSGPGYLSYGPIW
jgi:hypothetical protein